MSTRGGLLGLARRVLPASALPPVEWDRRHRWISRLLWAHLPAIVAFAVLGGEGVLHAAGEALPLVLAAGAAGFTPLGRPGRSLAAASGLLGAAAVLVHASGGSTELHFHFFVVIGVIALYQARGPFLLSIAFVAVHHALVGTLWPEHVYGHPAARQAPLLWAGVHTAFFAAAAAVSVVSWRSLEEAHLRAIGSVARSERRFRALIERSQDVVTLVDGAGRIAYDSPSCHRVLGYGADERVGRNALDFVHAEDLAYALERLREVLRPGAYVPDIRLRALHRDGHALWVDGTAINLLHDPSVEAIVINFRDVTERRSLEDQLAHQSFHDPLTGLANRTLLLERLGAALDAVRAAGPGRRRAAVIHVDLDEFRSVNEALGHPAGDAVLREAASRIGRVLGASDVASRLGSDEFALLLVDLHNPAQAYEAGARVLEVLKAPFEVAGGTVTLDASVGIALGGDGDDAFTVLRNAGVALRRAKTEGRGRYEIYEAGMHAAVVERMNLKADLARAVERDEFRTHYQPIVDLATGTVAGVEALVRWEHPDRGLVSPASFVPLAEETGLIVRIGAGVLRQACADAAGWQCEMGDRAPAVSVNLSARQLRDPGLVADVRDALSSSGLPPEALILEITETAVLERTEAAASTLGELRELGVRIALDDFGTGYSSLSHLARLPVDVVKIDRSFVEAIGTAETGQPLIAAIVDLCTHLRLTVTAEGVETVEQLEHLRRVGCHHGQGYLLARPRPLTDLGPWLGGPSPVELESLVG